MVPAIRTLGVDISLFLLVMRFFFFILYIECVKTQETLRFLQVWFRHGERLPTHYLHIPNDPLGKYLELGEGGELTNRGIQQEYLLGQLLKKTYGDFLGEYLPSQIHTFTGVDNRTVASAQALFAGLFPPTERRLWKKDFLWQPVAMQTEDSIDWVSTGIEDVCPTYEKKLFGSDEYRAIPGKLDQAVLTYLKNVTEGAPLEDVQQINHLIDSLVCRAALNDSRLPFPVWAEPVRDRLDLLHYNLHDKVLNLQNKTIGGYHIEKVLAYIEDHLQRAPGKKNKGVFLAAHDTNLIALGKAFNLQTIPKPNFGAHLIVELHEISGVNIVKFFYGNGVGSEVVEVKAEFCGIPCTLARLQALAEGHRTSEAELLKVCKNFGPIEGANPFVTGVLIALTAIFLLTTVIFGCTSHNYKKQLRELSDPERTHLLR